MYELENPETTALTAIQDLELPAELTQNNNFFGENTSETLPQNVNFVGGTDDILLEPSRMGTNLSFSEDSSATNEDPLTGETLDNIFRESKFALFENFNLNVKDSTSLGGSNSDRANGIATDKEGNIYIAGETDSPNFPVTPNAVQSSFGGGGPVITTDIFVSKISPDGTLLYSTYIGGSGGDVISDIAVDDGGNIYVTGATTSTDFPTVNALQNSSQGGFFDAFVVKISADGSNIIYSTYLGGEDNDFSNAIATDSEGNAYITGTTEGLSVAQPQGNPGDFPIAENVSQSVGGEFNQGVFVSKISADGSQLVYSTLLGGNGSDRAADIALDRDGNAYIVGGTSSADFPVANATQSTFGGNNDIFIAQLNSDGSDLVYSTFYGGGDSDAGSGIAVDNAGNIYVTGDTTAGLGDFPVVNGIQNIFGGGDSDGVVVKINSDRSVGYASFLGAGDSDSIGKIAVDAIGNAYVAGSTGFDTPPFPLSEGLSAFVTQISTNGATMKNLIIGGGSAAAGNDIALDALGNAYIVGDQISPEFPVLNFARGGSDIFVVTIAPPAPVSDIFAAFDESVYLAENPGVADAVADGIFATGLQHWIDRGISEGRGPQIAFDEEFYLATYPGVADAVADGTFLSGLEHYIFFGAGEGRLGSL